MGLLFAFLLFARAAAAQPDLIVDQAYQDSTWIVMTENFAPTSCEVTEGIISSAGSHKLLVFGTEVANIGTADLSLKRGQDWVWGACHGHWHYEKFTAYRLLDANGVEVGTGHKQAFCVEDVVRYLSTASQNPKFSCQHMGIQTGWADIYGNATPGQWIEIDTVPPGTYTLEVTVNFAFDMVESNYANDTTRSTVTIP